jgi:hypothetical protein
MVGTMVEGESRDVRLTFGSLDRIFCLKTREAMRLTLKKIYSFQKYALNKKTGGIFFLICENFVKNCVSCDETDTNSRKMGYPEHEAV